MNHDWPLFRTDAFPERPDKPDEGLGRFRDSEIRPSREVEVPDGPDGVSAHDPELGNVPVREVALVQDGHLQVEQKQIKRMSALALVLVKRSSIGHSNFVT